MSDFYQAIPRVLQNEGGLSNDSGDPGGLTNYGISQRSYPDLDIRDLTKEQAEEIYKRDFWDANRLGEINSQIIAGKVLDMCVNMGSYRGALILQDAVNNLGHEIAQDGKIGPATISAVNSTDEKKLHQELINVSVQFYQTLVQRRPNMSKFLDSWLHRARQ